MNKLRKQIQVCLNNSSVNENRVNKLEQITDDFSVKLIEWMHGNSVYIGNSLYRVINKDEIYTITELLQIFKNNIYGKV